MSDSSSGPPPGDQPGAWQQPYGQQPYGQAYGESYGQSYGQPPYGGAAYGRPRDPDQRPGTVTAAGLIAAISSGLVAVAALVGLIALVASRESLERELRTQPELRDAGFDAADLYGVAVGVLVVLVLWAVAGCVFGVLVLRRSRAGRILLVVSASAAALLSLLAIGSLFSVVTLLAAIASIVLVFVGGANEWFAGRAAAGYGPTYPGGYGQPPYGTPPPPQQPYGQQPSSDPYAPQQPYGQQPYGDPYPPQQPYGSPPTQPYAQQPPPQPEPGPEPGPSQAYPPQYDDPTVQRPWGKSADDG